MKIMLDLLIVFIEFCILLAAFLSGFSVWLDYFCIKVMHSRFYAIILFVTILFLAIEVVTFPLTFTRGWILPHKFNISRQTIADWVRDHSIAFGLTLLTAVLLVEIFYITLEISPSLWWVIFSLCMIFGIIVVARLLPLLIIPLFIKTNPLNEPELEADLRRLSEKILGKPLPVHMMHLSKKTRGATAMIAGSGSTRRMYLADTLLKKFSPDEIKVVAVHEMAHHFFGHLWKGLAVQSGVILLGTALLHLILGGFSRGVVHPLVYELSFLPLILIIWGIFSLLLVPLMNFILRRWEYQSDRFAIKKTGLSDAFISAMERLGSLNVIDPDPPSIIETLFHSHPSLKKRIEHAKSLDFNEHLI